MYGSRRGLLLCIVEMKMEEEDSHDYSVFVIDYYYFPHCVKFMNEGSPMVPWVRGSGVHGVSYYL